ncbi:MAG: hypothetical protein ACTJHC_02035 [Vagococcus sp.]
MENQEWLQSVIDELEKNSYKYEEKALFMELKHIVSEQYKRIEQAEGELDGTLWSPNKW